MSEGVNVGVGAFVLVAVGVLVVVGVFVELGMRTPVGVGVGGTSGSSLVVGTTISWRAIVR